MKVFTGFDFVVHPSSQTFNSFQSISLSESSEESSSDQSVLSLPKRALHHWTPTQRLILCFLDRWFISGSRPKSRMSACRGIQRAFTAYFADELVKTNQGLRGPSLTAIMKQLDDIWGKGNSSDEWRAVYMESDFLHTNGEWSATKLDFKAIIADKGIDLVERSSEDTAQVLAKAGNGLKEKKRRFDNICGVLGPNVDLDSEEEGERAGQPKGAMQRKKRRTAIYSPSTPRNYARYSGLLTPPTSPENLKSATLLQRSSFRNLAFRQQSKAPQGTTHNLSPLANRSTLLTAKRSFKSIPPIVFRVNDDQSHTTYKASVGFRAGAFSYASIKIPPPPEETSEAFRKAATIHLRRILEPSPFISVSESPLRPFHRGLRSTENAHISLIDLNHLNMQQRSDCPPSLYPARKVIRQLGIGNHVGPSGKAYYFSGAAEWIVWGQIEKAAILATFSIANFENYMAQNPTIQKVLRPDAFKVSLKSGEYRRLLSKTQMPLSHSAGESIGHFLAFTGLPLVHLEYAAIKIARAWQFTGTNSQPRKDSFLTGAREGFSKFHNEPMLPRPEIEDIEHVAIEEDEDSDGTLLGDDFDDFLLRRREIENIVGRLWRP